MAERVTSAEELLARHAEGERNFRDADLRRTKLVQAKVSEAKLSFSDLSGAQLEQTDLSGAQLEQTDLSGAQLEQTDLSCANLIQANLGGAKLIQANLCGARLSQANLCEADLSQANLCGADLGFANLSGADLSFANLCEAELSYANLCGADLIGSKLSNARLNRTIFANADLAVVSSQGLGSLRHRGPSMVDQLTLQLSRGQIPEVLLRGCGFADWEIELAKLHDPTLSAAQTSKILNRAHELRHARAIVYFSTLISHSHADKEFAARLHDALQDKGIRCWLDEKQLLPGDELREQTERGMRLWDKVILCASKDSLTSRWVDAELERAFQKEARLMKERGGEKPLALVPVDLDGYVFGGWKSARKADVTERYVADFNGWQDDFDAKLEPLIRALRADDLGREPAPQQRL